MKQMIPFPKSMTPVPKIFWLALILGALGVTVAMGAVVVERSKLKERTASFGSRIGDLQTAVEALQNERSVLTQQFRRLATSAAQLGRDAERQRLPKPGTTSPIPNSNYAGPGTGGQSQSGAGGAYRSTGSSLGGQPVDMGEGGIGGYSRTTMLVPGDAGGGDTRLDPFCATAEYGDESGTGALDPVSFCRLYLSVCGSRATTADCLSRYSASSDQQRCR